MLKEYAFVGVSVLVVAIIVLTVDAVLAFTYSLATGDIGTFHATLCNLLFFEGGIILTAGAVAEFFHVKRTAQLNRLLLSPWKAFSRGAPGESEKERKLYDGLGGWTLILLGGALIAFSALAILATL